MKNNITTFNFVRNDQSQVLATMKNLISKPKLFFAKYCFWMLLFLSFSVESNGQMMTFAENDINQTPMCTIVEGNILTNDCDPMHYDQWLSSVTFFNELNDQDFGPISGRPFQIFAENGTPAGIISIYIDGEYEFTPDSDFKGKVPIEYVVENASGATDVATLVIQVIPEDNLIRNDNPIAHDDTNTTETDTDVYGNVITFNDYDIDNDALIVRAGFADLDGDGIRGELLTINTEVVVYGKNMAGDPMMAGWLTLNTDGSYFFDPLVDFCGKLSIKYKISDGSTGIAEADLTILVLPGNDNQNFANDDIIIGKKNRLQSGNIISNDQGLNNDFQTVVSAKNNHDISLIIDGTTENELRSNGSLVIDMDGSFTYSPNAGFIGTESVTYVVCDNSGLESACDTATLYLTTIPFNNIGGSIGGSIGGVGVGSINNINPEISQPTTDFTEGTLNGVSKEFTLYPNPGIVGNDFISLRFESISDKAQIQIFDMTGRMIKRFILDANANQMNDLQVDVSDLIEGKYHLQLVDSANTYSQTFILINGKN